MAIKDPTVLNIVDKQSLIHVGSLDSFDITEGGKNAARLILEYLDKPDPDKLNEAIDIYEEIIPNENFGIQVAERSVSNGKVNGVFLYHLLHGKGIVLLDFHRYIGISLPILPQHFGQQRRGGQPRQRLLGADHPHLWQW